jgi:1,2-dihydroxy-3-keto-5-methylthiopentene dioxygenase
MPHERKAGPMSHLSVYADNRPGKAILKTSRFTDIKQSLADAGILLERWSAQAEITDATANAAILAAYRHEIDKLVAERGYQTVDVVSMHPQHPDKDAFRQKFLAEHTHSEDEVRFFVRGQGLFIIHKDGQVYSMLCEKDDLISVPANTRHWFDMGPNPRFTAIRLFNNQEGWVAKFTGDEIAKRFPLLDN